MNKLFPLHIESNGADYNRQYYRGTLEPIAIKTTAFAPFQYTRTGNDLINVYRISNGVTTDITYKFLSGSNLITTWTSGGYNSLTSYYADISALSGTAASSVYTNNFSLTAGDLASFKFEGTVTSTASDYFTATLYKGVTVVKTITLTDACELTQTIASTGTDYNVRIMLNGSSAVMSNATIKMYKALYSVSGSYVTYNGTALSSSLTTGKCTFKIGNPNYVYSDACEVYSSDFFTNELKISVSSSVDYGGIYYTGGFIQTLYRKGNVRRNPQPKVTVIGDERNGVIVREKVVTSTKYAVRIRITEELLDALTLAVGATVTITDQTGKVFTCNNLEIDKPDWYGAMGLVTLSFDDNINVFTQNSTL